MPGPGLQAVWIVEEADLHAATNALPGAALGLLRWPVAVFIAFAGVGAADVRVGAPFALGAGAVIAVAWLIIALARRGTELRRSARVPEEQRMMRLILDGDRVRLETASGHASECPLADLTHVRRGAKGVLLTLQGQVIFVPRRALAGSEPAWDALAARVPARRWPNGLVFTLGLWAFAVAVAGYAFVK
ncbi:MAG TPA: hypothetical protein VGQ83_05225 [Polyangia bacterium]